MKKTLVALAALTLVGAVSAQSSVTLYGRIDASLGSVKSKTAGVTADVGLQVRSGAHTGSRWGLRGSEDLGGGLKANFQLEQGFNVDNGTNSATASCTTAGAAAGVTTFGEPAGCVTRQFHRQAWVGLSGGFGSVMLGRQYSPIDNMWGSHDAMGYSGYSPMSYVWAAGGTTDQGRINNSVTYYTPAMGGFGAGLMWAPGENKAPGVSAGRHVSGQLTYNAGPIGFGMAYETMKMTGATPAINLWEIGGSYDMGVAKIMGGIEGGNNKITTVKDSGWMLGAVIPLGAPSLAFSYAREKSKTAGVESRKHSGIGALLNYPLSKRTYVYGAFETDKSTPTGGAATKTTRWGAGLVHNF